MERVYSAEELEVCEEVGRGGFGVVYRGVVKATNDEVAIKQIDLENDETDLLEINKEIQIISGCRLHQITKYLGCFVKNYKLWIIMEFVDGGSLFDLLKPGPISDESVLAVILKEILIALEYLHNQGKIHRDLKSQNILFNKRGDVKLTDFGVSTQLSSNFSRRNTTVGTPYWMAPEVIMNNNGGHSYKADIWSLGCCAYEMITGKPPLQKQYPPMKALRQISRCSRNRDFIELIQLDTVPISLVFKDFLTNCFIVDPKQRYSATKLLNHGFLKNVSKTPEKIKLLKKLITNKQLWDQENHVHRTQNYYVPTEIARNQKKWALEKDGDTHKTINFDLSSIQYSPSPKTDLPLPHSSKKSTTRESSPCTIGTPTSKDRDTSIDVDSVKNKSRPGRLTSELRPEFHRILNKVFHKLESKNNLTTDQYDQLVLLNEALLRLFTSAQSHEVNNQYSQKILACQYLKYFLKELTKQASDQLDAKTQLQRLVLPSTFNVQLKPLLANTPLFSQRAEGNEFDEIEHSLFESWMDRMTEKRT